MRARVPVAILLGLTGITVWSWRAAAPHPGGPSPTDELAEAAAAIPTTLIVDFRDDISEQALAANGYTEEPISRFSAIDRLYRIRFRSPCGGEGGSPAVACGPHGRIG